MCLSHYYLNSYYKVNADGSPKGGYNIAFDCSDPRLHRYPIRLFAQTRDRRLSTLFLMLLLNILRGKHLNAFNRTLIALHIILIGFNAQKCAILLKMFVDVIILYMDRWQRLSIDKFLILMYRHLFYFCFNFFFEFKFSFHFDSPLNQQILYD